MKPRTTRPGEFKARCDLPRWAPGDPDAVAAWRAHLTEPIPYGRGTEAVEAHRAERARLESAVGGTVQRDGEWGSYELCGFETEDRELFTEHMLEAHERKSSTWTSSSGTGPLTGPGFRSNPMTPIEKAVLGRTVTIDRHADETVTAQVWAVVDPRLLGARCVLAAVDDQQRCYVFAFNTRRGEPEGNAYLIDGFEVERQQGGVGRVALTQERAA